MSADPAVSAVPAPPLPDRWQKLVPPRLADGEVVLGWHESDLDADLRYSSELLTLTTRRLLGFGRVVGANAPDWHEWPVSAAVAVKVHERGGTGAVEVSSPDRLLAVWRFTLGAVESARGFVQKWDTAVTGVPPSATVCPACGEMIPPGVT
ncbi:MAG: hypothetical protein ACRC7O_09545, partial [Fimbriiglobus sp.]